LKSKTGLYSNIAAKKPALQQAAVKRCEKWEQKALQQQKHSANPQRLRRSKSKKPLPLKSGHFV